MTTNSAVRVAAVGDIEEGEALKVPAETTGQADAIVRLFEPSGLTVGTRRDLAGHRRCLTLEA